MIQFKHVEDFILIYNPINSKKWLSIDFRDGVFSVFSYFSGRYLIEYRYKNDTI